MINGYNLHSLISANLIQCIKQNFIIYIEFHTGYCFTYIFFSFNGLKSHKVFVLLSYKLLMQFMWRRGAGAKPITFGKLNQTTMARKNNHTPHFFKILIFQLKLLEIWTGLEKLNIITINYAFKSNILCNNKRLYTPKGNSPFFQCRKNNNTLSVII